MDIRYASALVERYADLGNEPVPVEPYISPEHFELEREKVFKRSWLNIGHQCDVPNRGDYAVKNIRILDASILVIHGRDGRIRAFYNTCQHRGNQLVYGEGQPGCAQGQAKVFACRFHGWVFDDRGSLLDVPDEISFHGLDKTTRHLKEFPTDVWCGFIFIYPGPTPTETLEAYLGENGMRVGQYPFAQLELVAAWKANVHCNWKVFHDAFQESYHTPSVHKRTLGVLKNSGGGADPLNHLVGLVLYDKHRVIAAPNNTKRTLLPTERICAAVGATLYTGTLADVPAGVNPNQSIEWGFDSNQFFPNFTIGMGNGFAFTYNFWPVSHRETSWEVRMYMRQATNGAAKVVQEYSKVLLRDALLEDASTVEATQIGLETGGIDTMVLSEQEIGIRHSSRVIRDMLEK